MTDTQLRTILNQELSGFFGQMTRYFDARFDGLEQQLNGKVDYIYIQLDGIIARLDEDVAERAAMNHRANRHERWINQLADTTQTKLIDPTL